MAKGSGTTRRTTGNKTTQTTYLYPVHSSGPHTVYDTDDVFKHNFNWLEADAARDISNFQFMMHHPTQNIMVDISRIHTTQETVDANYVNKIINEGGSKEPITGLKVGNEVYIFDGHHRAAAMIAKGAKDLPIKVVSVTKLEFKKKMKEIEEDYFG